MRSLKPEYWDDEELAMSTSRDARLLYPGLWNFADEHGRLRGDPRYVKGKIFAYDDDLTPARVDALIDELAGAGKVVRYRVGSAQYLFLPNLDKHQRLESAKVPSRLPAPGDVEEKSSLGRSAQTTPGEPAPDSYESARGADESARNRTVDGGLLEGDPFAPPEQHERVRANKSARDSDGSAPDSDESELACARLLSMEHVAGSREHVAGGAQARGADKPRRSRATRLPDDFTVTDEMKIWAGEKHPQVDIGLETDKFRDYWRGKSGKDATKEDWVATWRNWIRNSSDGRFGPNPSRASPGKRHQPFTQSSVDRSLYEEEF